MRPTSTANSLRMLLGGLLMSCALASASTFVVTDDELHPQVFPLVAESIRANLEGSEAPRKFSSAERRQIEETLDRMQALIAEDPERLQRQIRNLQIRVNAVLAPAVARNDSRSDVVCQRVTKVGSNIPTTECTTRAQREARERNAEDEVRRLQQGRSD